MILAAHLVPVSNQRDAESQNDGSDPHLSTDSPELTVLDSDDTPDEHDGSHDGHQHEHYPASFHIVTEAARPVNPVLVTGQN